MTDRKLFRRWVARLRREFPGRYPVRVLLVPSHQLTRDHGREMCGDCCFDDGGPAGSGDEGDPAAGRCTIRIAQSMNATTTRDTLIEEWAHYLQWHLLPRACREPEHGPVYAAIYSLILSSFRGDTDDSQAA